MNLSILSSLQFTGRSLVAKLLIALLGPFKVEVDGAPLTGFRSAKVRALLAYLAVESARPWSRGSLADLLWPDFREDHAQSNLRNAIANLRHLIGDQSAKTPLLLISQNTLQYNPQGSAWLDVADFCALLTASNPGGPLTSQGAEYLENALQLYRGEFLEGFAIDSAPFEEWIILKSEHFRLQVLEAHRRLVERYRHTGDVERVLQHARHWVTLEPWDETAHRHIMWAYLHKGQRNAALGQYETCRTRLLQDLAIEPEPATTELYEQIRSGQSDALALKAEQITITQPSQMPPFLSSRRPVEREAPLFVARRTELQRLNAELTATLHGAGRMLLVTGDPGSGKTSLLAEFGRQALLQNPQLVVVWGNCNAYTGEADPYFPFRVILQTLAGDLEARVLGGAMAPEHAVRLWRLLPKVIQRLLEDGPDLIDRFIPARELLATTQAIPGVQPELQNRVRNLLSQMSPPPSPAQLNQAALFSQYTKVLSSLSLENPLVLILDDLQWIDIESVNLFFHLARRLSNSHILLLGAYRPQEVAMGRRGERHPLAGVIHELQTSLGDLHLDLEQSEDDNFIDALLDSEPNQFSSNFRQMLLRQTGGNPLFTIELLRGMQQKGEIYRNPQGRWVEGTHLNWDALPVRVEAVLEERISQLPVDHQELLSIASVEGEQFSAEILARLARKDVSETIRILSQEISKRYHLVIAQSRKQIQSQTLSHYRFRHILYQKYLYQHLDAVERARLHEQIGLHLEKIHTQDTGQNSQVTLQLARHFELAGMAGKAVPHYALAGKHAMQLSANREAITHFEHAINLLDSLPETETWDQQRLNLHLSLGPPLIALQGWAAPELEMNYRRAEQLCQKMADDARLIPALWFLSIYRLGRSEHELVNPLLSRLVKLAEKIQEPVLLSLISLHIVPLYQGKLAQARGILTRTSESRDLELQRSAALQYGMSPTVVALAYLGNCLWLMGYPKQAEQSAQEAMAMAEQLQVPMTTCYALSRKCWQQLITGELEAAHNSAEELLQVSRKYELRNFELAAQFFLRFIHSQQAEAVAADLEAMHQAMEEYRRLGTMLNRTTFLNLFALACATNGDIERGLESVDEAISLAQRTTELWFAAESYRIKGELLRLQAQDPHAPVALLKQAESCYETARQIARQQGARQLELRAVINLCQLWHDQGKSQSGITHLEKILSQFSEGLHTPDLRTGYELLERLTD